MVSILGVAPLVLWTKDEIGVVSLSLGFIGVLDKIQQSYIAGQMQPDNGDHIGKRLFGAAFFRMTTISRWAMTTL